MKQAAKWIVSRLPVPVAYHVHRVFHAIKGDSRGGADRAYLASWPRPLRVRTGPFRGLIFPTETYNSSIVASLLGVYEKELHDSVERLCARQPDLVVDIGAAEGYYSVGMALRNPQARNVAFEMFKPARHILNRVATVNGVTDRFESRGACTPESLQQALAGAMRPVVVCDCEGAEDQLLDPTAVPALARAAILVELHDNFCPGVSTRIRQRFEPTHSIETFHTRERTPADLPPGVTMSAREFDDLVVEKRGCPQIWYVMEPRQAG